MENFEYKNEGIEWLMLVLRNREKKRKPESFIIKNHSIPLPSLGNCLFDINVDFEI